MRKKLFKNFVCAGGNGQGKKNEKKKYASGVHQEVVVGVEKGVTNPPMKEKNEKMLGGGSKMAVHGRTNWRKECKKMSGTGTNGDGWRG